MKNISFKNKIKNRNLLLIILFFSGLIPSIAQPGKTQYPNQVMLPNGWQISPAGTRMALGDLPLYIAVSPTKKLLAITNNGQSDQSIMLIDAEKNVLLDSVIVESAWLGLTFSGDGKSLFASGGNGNYILHFEIKNQKLILHDTIRLGKSWPEKISPAGIAMDNVRQLLYVVTKENNSVYRIDLKTGKVLDKFLLDGEAYTCLLSPDRKTLYISCWGCDKVQIFDTENLKFKGFYPVGDNPNDMCMTRRGTFLFVANSNDNSVSLIDLHTGKVLETLDAALYPSSPTGSTTNSVALSEDEQTLYIANADNNCLAVFDVSRPGFCRSKGFIPVGWYPTCVRVSNGNIFVTNGKGFSSYANPSGPNPTGKVAGVVYQKGSLTKEVKEQYIGGLFRGSLSIIPEPDELKLSEFSRQVYRNTPHQQATEIKTIDKNPIPFQSEKKSPVKYVFYIIKENRTYDQVLGDMPEGNGDTNLVLFGKKITPNQHALAKEFVLFDNFYVDGEVSADGHNWSTAAYSTDYLEKTWPGNYGGRGGDYDAEGNRNIANNKNGFIWDLCNRHHVSYRTYGEFADNYKPNIPVLKDHFCKYFTSWDQKVRDTTRYYQWKRDFDSLLAISQVPRLSTLRFINDHTEGMSKGRPTPFAHVADNDLAVGLFIEHLSKSTIWKESAVFIVEDDAQNGPDHVDAHRSTMYVAGGFVKRNFVDHTMYSTSSVLRTIELILGLPPMSQYDAAATPLRKSFSDTASTAVFNARAASVDLKEVCTIENKWQKKSEKFDFNKEDRAPDRELNEVIWVSVKGENILCPPPKHAAFFKQNESKDDD